MTEKRNKCSSELHLTLS